MKLSIIIPVYNEEKTVAQLLEKVAKISMPNIEKEVIIVDDGSTDATEKEISSMMQKFSGRNIHMKKLKHKKNLGKGTAIRTGLKFANGDYIIIQDADLEYDPKNIQELIKPIRANKSQVIYGTRLRRMPNLYRDERTLRFLLHYIGNKMLSLITSALFLTWITDMESGHKLFPRKALEKITLRARGFDFEPEITAKLLKNKYKIIEIPITTDPRGYKEGKKLQTFRDGFRALWTLIKYRFID